jgi:DNA-binding transcriptional LysR family regulator
MELRHLRYFVAVAEDLHFSRAAERLNIATPTLSAQIRALESMLGVQLFIRSTRGVTLTEAGQRVLEEARLTLCQADRTMQVGRHAGRGEVGSIAIGYIFGPSVGGVVSSALADFRKSHPHVSFTLQKTETLPQLRALAEGNLDVGFMRTPGKYPSELAGFVVDTQELWLAVPAAHPLAACSAITPEQLVSELFLAHPIEHELFLAASSAAVAPPEGARRVSRVSDIISALILVASGAGLTVVPKSVTQVGMVGVVYRRIGGKPRYADYVAVFRKAERSPAVKAFVAMLRARHRRMQVPAVAALQDHPAADARRRAAT